MNMQTSDKKALRLDRDAIWAQLCDEAQQAVQDEPLLGSLIHAGLLHHPSFEAALAYRFSLKLASGEMSEQICARSRIRLIGRRPNWAMRHAAI